MNRRIEEPVTQVYQPSYDHSMRSESARGHAAPPLVPFKSLLLPVAIWQAHAIVKGPVTDVQLAR